MMTLYDEINLLMERLSEEWGSVLITCDGGQCLVEDAAQGLKYEAETLIEALRQAVKEEEG
jgi:hypothetical protein